MADDVNDEIFVIFVIRLHSLQFDVELDRAHGDQTGEHFAEMKDSAFGSYIYSRCNSSRYFVYISA